MTEDGNAIRIVAGGIVLIPGINGEERAGCPGADPCVLEVGCEGREVVRSEGSKALPSGEDVIL